MPEAAGLYYRIYDQAARLPVVLIHGAGGNHLHWPTEIRRLPGVRVYALDLPGHGKSPGAGQQSISAYVDTVLRWMEGVGLHRAVFVGHSMGGAIALWLGLASADHVLALVLLGTTASMKVNPTLMKDLANTEHFERAVSNIISWSYSRKAPESLKNIAYRRMLKIRPSVLFGDFLACEGFDVGNRLGELMCPVLALCGEEDRMTPTAYVQRLVDMVPQARLEVIPGAGHMVMLEKPQSVADIVLRFLQGVKL